LGRPRRHVHGPLRAHPHRARPHRGRRPLTPEEVRPPMAYTRDDPRSTLAAPPRAPRVGDGAIAAPEFLDFSVLPPDVVTPGGSNQWIARGQNFVLIYTEPAAGDVVFSSTLKAEQVLLLIDATSSLRGTAGVDGPHEVTGPALVVVPPGESTITSTGTGAIVQLLESGETEWAE